LSSCPAHDAAKAAFPVGFVVMWVIFDRIKQAADKNYGKWQILPSPQAMSGSRKFVWTWLI
jgi:D-alanyl-lipoteichoic acid acyltransferase DltB (MBOAT superfamily)